MARTEPLSGVHTTFAAHSTGPVVAAPPKLAQPAAAVPPTIRAASTPTAARKPVLPPARPSNWTVGAIETMPPSAPTPVPSPVLVQPGPRVTLRAAVPAAPEEAPLPPAAPRVVAVAPSLSPTVAPSQATASRPSGVVRVATRSPIIQEPKPDEVPKPVEASPPVVAAPAKAPARVVDPTPSVVAPTEAVASPSVDNVPQAPPAEPAAPVVVAQPTAVEPPRVAEATPTSEPTPPAAVDSATNDVRPERMASVPSRNTKPDLKASPTEAPQRLKAARVEIERPADAGQHWWPVPESLLTQLESLRWNPETAAWAMDIRTRVFDLVRVDDPASREAMSIVHDLRELTSPQCAAVANITATELSTDVRLAQFAVARRLDVWSQVPHLSGALAARPDPARLSLCLADVRATMAESPESAAWQGFLLLDALKELAEGRKAVDADRSRELANEVLGRLATAKLTREQQRFVRSGAVAKLGTELRHWAGEATDPRQMLFHIEQFEETRLPSHARLVAMHAQRVALSPSEPERQLSHALESHYRNANLRVTVTQELMDRLVPAQQSRSQRLNDVFMGLPTRGWSTTNSQVQLRLIPDPHRLRWAIEAEGKIASETDTTSGPVMLRTHSDSAFFASKELEFTLEGLLASPVEVESSTRPRLRWVRSAFDHVPVLRGIVHDIARNKNEESKPEANREARRKISREVSEMVDQETTAKINTANDRWREKVLLPLENLQLQPELIEAQTTAEQILLRLRIANELQLAGHAPRPRAPINSLCSVQLHQSLLTNICEQLKLEGRTLNLPELVNEICTKFNMPKPEEEIEHHDLSITFAAENAVQLRSEEGRIEVTLAIARLQKGGQGWNDFVIKAYYRPEPDSPRGELVREGTVRLAGERLGPKAQIALRGIFSKVFPANKGVPILPEQVTEHPKLAKVRVTQFEIHNGWIAVAIGDEGVVARRN